MPPGAPDPPPAVIALVIVAAVATCMMAAAILVPTMLGRLGAWPALAGGLVALVAALAALWLIQRRHDRPLR